MAAAEAFRPISSGARRDKVNGGTSQSYSAISSVSRAWRNGWARRRCIGLMDRFFELFLSFVHRYEGRINQFLGDGFMALFESRAAREDHEERAALAASRFEAGSPKWA